MLIHNFAAQALGLSEREVRLLLSAMNGCVLHRIGDAVLPPEDAAELLLLSVSAAATSESDDYAALGHSLTLPQSGTAETPLEFHDLAEKIAAMSTTQRYAIVWWTTGWWEGLGQAQAQEEGEEG